MPDGMQQQTPDQATIDAKLIRDITARYESLKKIRTDGHEPKWKEISRFVEPTLGQFPDEQIDTGKKVHGDIVNSEATMALNVAVAGLLAGTMSPSRPWFKLEVGRPGSEQSRAVKNWLEDVQQLLLDIFNESTFYQAVPSTLKHALSFANGCLEHLDDFENVAYFEDVPGGSFVWATDDRSTIDTFGSIEHYTANRLAARFGEDVLPENVKSVLRANDLSSTFEVLRWVEPNKEYNPTKGLARFKRFASFYLLISGSNATSLMPTGSSGRSTILRRSGFDEFPFHPLRWDVKGDDIFATGSPGINTLGDCKQLQLMEKQKMRALQKVVDPPVQGPANLQGKPLSLMPGSANLFHGGGQADKGLRAVYQINPYLQDTRVEIQAVEARIREGFFNDLFFAISRMEGIQPKNMLELSQRNQERLLQLGPVLLRLHREFLGGIISRTFNQCVRADIVPPAPEEIADQPLRIRYVSTMALAQQQAETASIDEMVEFAGRMAAVGLTDALDKIDSDQMVEHYSDVVGAPASTIRSQEDTDAIRQQRAQQQAIAQSAEVGNEAAGAMNQLAQAGATANGAS